MAKKSLIILLVLAVVVAGAIGGTIIFLGQQNAQEQKELAAAEPTATSNANLSDAAYKTITYVKLSQEDSVIELKLNDSIWSMVGNLAAIDQVTAGSISTYLSYIYATQIIDIGNTPLSAYGLDPGDFVVTYTTNEGTFTNYYGKYTSDRSAVFFRKEGDNNVYTIDVEYFDGVKNDLDTLRDRAINIPGMDVTGYIAFKAPGEPEIVLQQVTESNTYTPVPWVMISPVSIPITKDAESLIINSFGTATLTGFVGDEVLPEYGLDGETWMEYRDYSGNVITQINFGALGETGTQKEYDSFYCAVDGKEGVFLIPRFVVDAASSSVFSLIDQRFIPIDDFSSLDKLTITKDDKTVILTQSGGTYTLNGESISQEQSADLFNKGRTVNFIGEVTGSVSALPYCTMLVEREGFSGKDINIKVYLYLKDFYAIDYGSGPEVYVKAELMDGLLDYYFDFEI